MTAKRKAKKVAKKVDAADVSVSRRFTPLRKNPVVRAIGTASEIGDQPPLYALSAGVLAAGVLGGNRRTAKAGVRMLAAHFVTIRVKDGIKRMVDRTRPNVMAEQGRYKLGKGEHEDSDYSSFPSGHTASALAVALALGREYPGLRGGALVAAGAIAGAQVLRSKHYVGDLAAGAVIGLAAELVANRWLRQMERP